MNYDLHQVIAGYLDVCIGLILGLFIFIISRRYEIRTSRKNRLLNIQSRLSTAYSGICDARWISRTNPTSLKNYHQMLITISNHRGVFVDVLHEFRSTKLLKEEKQKLSYLHLKQIDAYLLSLLKEAAQFDPETGLPKKNEDQVNPFAGDHPLYEDFISEWSTRVNTEPGCVASQNFRHPFHILRDEIEAHL